FAVRIHTKNLIDSFVADIEESCRIPHRPFSKSKATGNRFQLRVAADEFRKLGRELFELETSCLLSCSCKCRQSESRRQECKRNTRSHSSSSSHFFPAGALVFLSGVVRR